jgi:D-alanyl-lipoteichoic acid acyltransferase DltB (MBOAT superfamily)
MGKTILLSVIILSTIACAVTIRYSEKELKPPLLAFLIVVICFCIVLSLLQKDAEYQKNLILLGGIGITIISWFVNGYINNENEKNRNQLSISQSILQSKRDLKVKFLLDAYFRLENADMRDITPQGHQPNLYDYIYLKYTESALTSIQLLAKDSTVKLANLYLLSGGKGHYSELLIMLRDELRQELNLESLPATKEYHPSSYRTYRKIGAPNSLTQNNNIN